MVRRLEQPASDMRNGYTYERYRTAESGDTAYEQTRSQHDYPPNRLHPYPEPLRIVFA